VESISKRMLEYDGHGEVSGWFRLHSKNLAANAGLCAGVVEGSNSKRHLYRGTLGNQRSTRKQMPPRLMFSERVCNSLSATLSETGRCRG
jgi:hypothetical protein